MNIDAKAFGLACGLLWTVAVFVLALLAMQMDYATEFVSLIGTVYKGYGPTMGGALMGIPWAFVDAFIGGWLLAALYNKLAK